MDHFIYVKMVVQGTLNIIRRYKRVNNRYNQFMKNMRVDSFLWKRTSLL